MPAHQNPATVGELKALLDELPDWASVLVASHDETGCLEESAPRVDYAAGVLTIEVA